MSDEEIFKNAFPYYLSIGMTYEQYWEGNPILVRYYHDAHLLKIEQKNQELWLQGLYFFYAISPALYNSNPLGSKTRKLQKYIEEPIRITPLTEEERKEKERKEKGKIISYLNKLKTSWDKKGGRV